METYSFHYAKITGIILLIAYIVMTSGFTFALTLQGEGILHYIFMLGTVAFCLFVILFYLLKKWLIPAFRNEPIITINDKTLTLKNSYSPIPWTEIDTIYYRGGRYGNVIGIRLKDLDKFLSEQPLVKSGKGLKFNRWLYGYHFGISTTLVKEWEVYEVINDYFKRFSKNN